MAFSGAQNRPVVPPGGVIFLGSSVDESIPVRTMFPEINLEALLGAAELPGIVLALEISEVEAHGAAPQVDVAEGHAAEVGDVADAAVDLESAVEGDRSEDHDQVLRFYRDEVEYDGRVGVEQAERHEQAINRARCAQSM